MKPSKKVILLVGGILLMLLVSYHLAFRKTFKLQQEYNDLQEISQAASGLNTSLLVLRQESNYLDSVLLAQNLLMSSRQNNLLRQINFAVDAKHGLQLKAFNEPHVFDKDDFIVNSQEFELQGQFIPILETLYQIEHSGNYGSIIHLDIEKPKYSKNKHGLNATVLIQTIQ